MENQTTFLVGLVLANGFLVSPYDTIDADFREEQE